MQTQAPKTEVSQHELEIIAEHIERLTKAAETLRTSRLKENTILVLLKDMTGMAQRDIKIVLDALAVASEGISKTSCTTEANEAVRATEYLISVLVNPQKPYVSFFLCEHCSYARLFMNLGN